MGTVVKECDDRYRPCALRTAVIAVVTEGLCQCTHILRLTKHVAGAMHATAFELMLMLV